MSGRTYSPPSSTARPVTYDAPGITRSRRKPRRASVMAQLLMTILLLYSLLPLVWLLINSTKTQQGLLTTFGLWFAEDFAFWSNLSATLTYDDGIFVRWLGNTLLYVVVGAGGATLLATIAGYGLAKFQFRGKRVVFASVVGAVAIPGTATAVPTFLLFSQVGLANTPWAVIIPSLMSPFGMYLVWAYALDAVPTEILESARVDGAGELRTFLTIGVRLLAPAMATVALFNVVHTWNNYFLPLIMLSDPAWYPLTVGLNQWNNQASTVGADVIYNLVITGSLIMVVPIIIAFLFLQRFWQSGLVDGSVKG